MTVNSYINFEGNCKEAMEFYGNVFGSEPKYMTFEDMPDDPDFAVDENVKNFVMYGEVEVCGNRIMFSDVLPGMKLIAGNKVSISLASSNEEKLTNWFQGLSDGGKIVMPLEPTFWSGMYGLVVDKYGVQWHVNKSK